MNDTKIKTSIEGQNAAALDFKRFFNLQKQGILCDLTLRSKDGLEFKVHKPIMYLASGFFRALISSDFKDSSSDILQLDVCTGATLKEIISFMYREDLKANKSEDLLEIGKLATYLQMTELTELCTLRLQQFIHDDICLSNWRQAEEYLMENVEEMCILYIVSSAQRLFKNASFVNGLTASEMKTILGDKRLKCSPETIFRTVAAWAKNNTNSEGEMLKLFSELIDYIPFSSLSKEFLLSNVLQDEVLVKDKNVITELVESIKKNLEENEYARERKQMAKVTSKWRKQFLAIRGTDILGISTERREMEKICDNSYMFINFGYTTFGNNLLLACGGIKPGTAMAQNCCKYFSPVSREWTTLAPMFAPRAGHKCTCIDGRIYACGGVLDAHGSSVEVFDPNIEKWTCGPKMTNRGLFGLTSFNSVLYAIGGDYAYTEILDPRSSNKWMKLCSNSNQYYKCTKCVSIGYDIYCFTDSSSCFIFDTRENKYRNWVSLYNHEWSCSHVFSQDSEIGAFFPKSCNFSKFNVEGENMFKCSLASACKSESDQIGALAAMYY